MSDTFDAIAQDLLVRGTITPPLAKTRALDLAREMDEGVRSSVCTSPSQMSKLIEASRPIAERTLRVIEKQDFPPCLRAGFFAAFYDTSLEALVTPVSMNRVPRSLGLDCRLGTTGPGGMCIRSEVGRSGDYYGNCPSLHAAESLRVPDTSRPSDVLFLEGGAYLSPDGTYRSDNKVHAGDDYSKRLYRCTMCLKHCLGEGVTKLGFVNLDLETDEISIFLGHVPSHLAAMTICNAANDMTSH